MTQSGTEESRTPKSRGGFLDRWFKISDRGSTVGQEIRGGLVTFFAMAYIVALNPLIIGTVADSGEQYVGGMDDPKAAQVAVAATTALIAGVVTILMGAIANYPLGLATGLGLNAFLAFGVASQMTWADAMGLIVLEGLIILVLVLTGFRRAVFRAVPKELKAAIGVGIGLYVAFIGFVNSGFVRPADGAPVQLGADGFLSGWPILVFVVGLLGTAILQARRIKGALLIGIVGATVVAVIVEAIARVGQAGEDNPTGWQLNVPSLPERWLAVPDFSLLGHFSLFGSFQRVGVIAALLLIFTLMLADFFDTMGTMTAVGAEAGLLDKEGFPPNTQRILVVDSIAAAAGGAASVSSNTSYVESAAGVGEGARTGLASVVTGGCFLLATVFAPVVEIIPYEAATPALVVVGFLMLAQVTDIPWRQVDVALPAFLTIVLMPFTYSISTGIGAGFVSYAVLKLFRGRAREVHPLLWLVAALFVVYFAMDGIRAALGIG